jgi:hypothetical protein
MPQGAEDIFERMVWQPDRMLLDDLVFRLHHYQSAEWDGGDCFMFCKIRKLVDQYARFLGRRRDFRPQRIMELGILDGGSIAFWHEIFRPQRHVAIDRMHRTDSRYFQQYVQSRGLSDRIRTFWKTSQANQEALRRIVATEFDGPVDLVIDDASHLYGPTLASFEALFPAMSPGGLYIIEDWAWGHWRELVAHESWAGEVPLTRLVVELIEAMGTDPTLIAEVDAFEGFVAVERGPGQVECPAAFRLKAQIHRAAAFGRGGRLRARVGRALRRMAGAMKRGQTPQAPGE